MSENNITLENYDRTFFTNDENDKLSDRFEVLLKDTKLFDCLVGYFYVSGFYKLQDSLKNTEKIRILVGMGIDSQTFHLIEKTKTKYISSTEYKKKYLNGIISEMNNSEDNFEVERGAKQFLKWLKEGKIEIKGYKKRKTHSKLYIMTFEDKRDKGRIITGSSNFTRPGLEYNLEFNVELKDSVDFIFAQNKFEELWNESEPITSEFINTLNNKTWIREDITPYELFLKFIYEYLYEKIDNDKKELDDIFKPDGFKYLSYQRDAVIEAKSIVEKYGGVFLSDVVGLGKTYMGALLAQQLEGKTLVIAPPALIDKNNPGGWYNILDKFNVTPYVESKGKLDQIINRDYKRYDNIIIDEAHDFRNQDTNQYELLAEICKNKKVILVSATPFNNSPMDLLSLIRLFQPAHNSTLPNPKVKNLERYFIDKNNELLKINKNKYPEKFIEKSQEISKEIREDVLKHVMIRRTRNSVLKYYKEDLDKNNMKFPNVKKPKAVYYEFDEYINKVFDETLYLITKKLTYAKYRPLSDEYLVNPDPKYSSSQKSTSNFMKILLIKRLESGSYAFKKSINNSIKIHKKALETLEIEGVFYTSRDYNRIYNMFEEDMDVDRIEELINKGKIKEYKREEFLDKFIEDLNYDVKLLEYLKKKWSSIEDYPKRRELINLLNSELKDKKIIIFTEFIDTATDISNLIRADCREKVMMFSGKSSENDRNEVLANFDDNISKDKQKNDYRILVTTDSLSHGVNLHRSNIIINFDIPWNPTKMMQRVGRVQRLDTKFDEIYTYNFFPTEPIEKTIGIKSSAENKINMFIELLGNDSQLLTEEPIKSHDLFNKLNSDLTNEEEFIDDELKYLNLIRTIRNNNTDLYNYIANIPLKARVGRKSNENSLITLIKQGEFKRIYKTNSSGTSEIDFYDAIKELHADINEKGISIGENYYEYLYENLHAFNEVSSVPDDTRISVNEKRVIKRIDFILQNKITNNERKKFNKIREIIEKGYIHKRRLKFINKQIKEKEKTAKNQTELFFLLKDLFLESFNNDDLKIKEEKTEAEIKKVILSEHFIK